MLHPSYSELISAVNSGVAEGEEPVVNSRYSIVIATAKRARQLVAGEAPLVDADEKKKPLSVAVDELYNRQVRILSEDEIAALETGEQTTEPDSQETDEEGVQIREKERPHYSGISIDDYTDEDIEELTVRARELYDGDLLANNELDVHIASLKAEIKDYKDHKRIISAVSVAASTNVDFFEDDGFEFARIYCGYNVTEGSSTKQVRQIFLLRRDEDRRWKIYGWDSVDHVNPQ